MVLEFPNAVVLNAVVCRNMQMHAKERKRAQKQKSAEERRRAQKSVEQRKRALVRKNWKQPGLKEPGMGNPKWYCCREGVMLSEQLVLGLDRRSLCLRSRAARRDAAAAGSALSARP